MAGDCRPDRLRGDAGPRRALTGEEATARTPLNVYVLSIVASAAFALTLLPYRSVADQVGPVLLIAGLAGLVGTRPVRFASLKTQVTATDPFVLAALAAFGPIPAVVVSIVGAMGVLWGQQKRTRPVHVVFNFAALALAVVASYGVFRLAGGQTADPLLAMLGPLGAATAAYFVTNTGLVASAIAVDRRQSFLSVWQASFQWTAVAAFAGLTLAVGLIAVLQAVGPWGLGLGVPPCWLLLAFYRTYKQRLEEQRRRVLQVERLNLELERKVADRTHELSQALTRIETTNAELLESNRKLFEANRSKSNFLAAVSHELRTPLNAIIGFSGLLEDSTRERLESREHEYLTDIRESGEHLLELINNILDLSKIEAGRLEARRKAVEVGRVVRDSVHMVRVLAEKKELSLETDQQAAVDYALLDPGMFRQVIVNLLSNAVKFTPEGGTIRVSVRADDGNLVVEVADTGVGIDPEMQANIFVDFHQVDSSYAREYQGTGLGLALVRRMMGLHEGGIEVESTPGEGSTFRCTFPDALTARPEAPQPTVPRAEEVVAVEAEVRSNRLEQILVIDPNPLARRMARNALVSRGYRVDDVDDAAAARRALEQGSPDMVISEIEAGEGPDSGWIEELAAHAARDHLCLVVCTEATDETRSRAEAAGCDGMIAKPIRLAHFAGEVERCFRREEDVA